jgi:hypothetical protein
MPLMERIMPQPTMHPLLQQPAGPLVDTMQARLDRMPDAHGRAPVDYGTPYGNLQIVDGKHAVPDQDAEAVRTEMSLHVLAYNMKRVIAIIGIGPLLQAMRA